jgi:transcriptional regulator with XRE-family HTH domain
MKVRVVSDIEANGLGRRIKTARKHDPQRRSVAALAAAAGISRAWWYRLEGELVRGAVPMETLRAVEAVLEVDLGVTNNG